MNLPSHNEFTIFSNYQKQNFLTDIKLKTKDGEIYAHKIILSSQSEYFETCFGNEKNMQSTQSISLEAFDHHKVVYVIDYMYKRIKTISFVNVKSDMAFFIDVLVVADYLRMNGLILEIDEVLSKFSNEIEIFNALVVNGQFNLPKTYNSCLWQFQNFINKKEYGTCYFKSIPITLLIWFLNDSRLSVNEDNLWKMIKDVLSDNKFEFSSNNECYQTLINCLRFTLLNKKNKKEFLFHIENLGLKWRGLTMKEIIQTETNHSESRLGKYLILLFKRGNWKVRKYSVSFNKMEDAVIDTGVNEGYQFYGLYDGCLLFHLSEFHINVNLVICKIFDMKSNKTNEINGFGDEFLDVYNGCDQLFNWSVLKSKEKYYFVGGAGMNTTVIGRGAVHSFNHIVKYEDNIWKVIPELQLRGDGCFSMGIALDNNDGIWIVGGRDRVEYKRSFYRIDLVGKTVQDFPDLPITVSHPKVDVIDDGKFILVHSLIGIESSHLLVFNVNSNDWAVFNYPDIECGFVQRVRKCCTGVDKYGNFMFYEAIVDDRGTYFLMYRLLDATCGSVIRSAQVHEVEVGMGDVEELMYAYMAPTDDCG